MKPLFELVKVSKVYDAKPPFEALKNISFKVKEGEFLSIIGPSGSGKSTFLHLLGFLDKPTSGEIFFEGAKTSEMSEGQLARIRQKDVGFVFQAFNLAPTLTVFKNVELPLIIQGMNVKERKELVEKHLAVVGLSDKKNNLPSQLSGGEKQRVAIARALVTNPKVILADEPTGNLDSKSGKAILDFIAKLHKERGITVILVTHDPYVATYAERTIYIKDGMIQKETKRKAG
ncbi:MAG: ABC transporter ATP-binding protein [Candidatus Micrarchaeia archaeon]